MKNIKKIAIAMLLLVFTNTIALAASGDTSTWTTNANDSWSTISNLAIEWSPKLVSKTDTSLTLEWSKVTAAAMYIVKYDKKSVANWDVDWYWYESEPTVSTWTIIPGLDPLTDYYFSVVVLDSNGTESDVFSDELKVKTDDVKKTETNSWTWADVNKDSWEKTDSEFSVISWLATDNKTIVLEFNNILGSWEITVKDLTKTSNNSNIPVVSEAKVDPVNPKKAIIKVIWILDPSSTYSITVISATDDKWENIKQWIAWITEFTTLDNLPIAPELLNLSAGWAEPIVAWSGSEAAVTDATASWSSASWATNVDIVAPVVWANQNLIVVMALILSLWIVYIYRRRTAK